MRVAFLVALDELDRAGALLADAKERGGLAAFYADEDFAREIAAPKFAELRAKYPDPRKK